MGGRGQITFILLYYLPISRNERQDSVTGMLMPHPYDLICNGYILHVHLLNILCVYKYALV